jgi:hypothetical protein
MRKLFSFWHRAILLLGIWAELCIRYRGGGSGTTLGDRCRGWEKRETKEEKEVSSESRMVEDYFKGQFHKNPFFFKMGSPSICIEEMYTACIYFIYSTKTGQRPYNDHISRSHQKKV